MHSVFIRFYKTLNFIIPSIAVLLIGSYFLSTLEPQRGEPVCSLRNVEIGKAIHQQESYSSDPQDLARLVFDLECNVESLWHWNTKMLYIHLKASFVGLDGVQTDVTVWDRRLTNKGETSFSLHKAMAPYSIVTHDIGTIPEPLDDVTFSLSVSETPFGGMMRYHSVRNTEADWRKKD